MSDYNSEILRQLTRIADALELAILPQNNQAYAGKVEEVLNVKNAEQELAPKEEVKQESAAYTHDDLKKLCLNKSREDIANKPKLKSLLKEYGAAKANDVPNDKLGELIERINKGEF